DARRGDGPARAERGQVGAQARRRARRRQGRRDPGRARRHPRQEGAVMAAGREATGPPGHQDEWFTLRWRDGAVEMLDQRKLPRQELYVTLRSVEEVAQAIETMVVRGAPAIGCAAALGVA